MERLDDLLREFYTRAKAEHTAGKPLRLIADEAGISVITLVKHLRTYGFTWDPHARNFSEEEIKDMVDSYNSGEALSAIQGRYRAAYPKIRAVLVRGGCKIRKGNAGLNKERNKQIAALFQNGIPQTKIAEIYGVSRERIRQVIERQQAEQEKP